MKHLSIHPSMDAFKSEMDGLIRPHVSLIKEGSKPIIGYCKEGGEFTAHEQGSAAFVDLGGSSVPSGPTTPHGGVVVEYNFTSDNRLLSRGGIYDNLEALYLDGQLYDIDNLILNVDESASGSASGSGSGAEIIYKSIEMPASVSTGKHTVEFCIGSDPWRSSWLRGTTGNLKSLPNANNLFFHSNGTGYVSLGLPSGRVWAMWNIGSTANEIGLGDYFMWASTSPHTNDELKEADAPYFANPGYSKYIDAFNELELMDDAAHVILGGSWRIPSIEDWKELFENTNHEIKYNGGTSYYEFKPLNSEELTPDVLRLPICNFKGEIVFDESLAYWTRISKDKNGMSRAYFLTNYDPFQIKPYALMPIERYFATQIRAVI